ncbi:MAG: hypothetical protein ACPL3S_00220 [Halothiobacillaceae bacterium]
MAFLKRKRASAQSRIGVAIGEQGILAVRVDSPFGPHPRIGAYAYHPHADEASWPQAFAEFVRDLSADGLPVVVSVHPQLASLLQLALPDVPEAELASALKFRAREMSSIPVDDMVLDYVDIPGMRVRGGERFSYCAVARLSQMRALRDAIKTSGLTLEAIDIGDMALRYVLARVLPQEENAALLFVGEQGSRVLVARADRLYLFRTSPIGAQQLQQSPLDQVDGPSPGRIQGLLLEIQRTLDFYDSHFTEPPPRHIWLAPQWSFIPLLADKLGEQLRLPVRQLVLADIFEGDPQMAEEGAGLTYLALGAALRPPEERATKKGSA